MSDIVFDKIKEYFTNMDPVSFSEKNLTLDGKKFRIHGNGYKPYAELYRCIGIKALEKDSLPIIICKSRQVGLTTAASVLEMYFMGCGLFGTDGRPPMRIIHAFPQLELAFSYSKTKLNNMISSSNQVVTEDKKHKKVNKTFMQSLLDQTSATNDSLQFKQFIGGNHLWIESVGLDGQRLRGKQLSLDTELPTPTGFIKLSDLKVGDQLFDEKGNLCNVLQLHPINTSPKSYKLTFDDGTEVKACADHLWLTHTKLNRSINTPPTVKTTQQIVDTLKVSTEPESNHSISNSLPLNYKEKELPIDPYLLGLWLGDGSSEGGAIETADPEILSLFPNRIVNSSIGKSKSSRYRILGLTSELVKFNLLHNKHIPEIYLYGSFEQRLALLQGLCDTDAYCDRHGRVGFCSVIPVLSHQVHQLILSLGIKARINKNESLLYNKRCKERYRINFVTRLPVFRLHRKLCNIKTNKKAINMSTHRYIVNAELISSIPMRCITVDSPSHLFLITRSFLPTHNTADAIFFDECFPYDQNIETIDGKMKIGKIYQNFISGKEVPVIKTFNEKTEVFEFNKILNVWESGKRDLLQITCGNQEIRCTYNHKFLTENGWVCAQDLIPGTLLKTSPEIQHQDQGQFKSYCFTVVDKITKISKKEMVYDITVENNHNFIISPSRRSKNSGGPIVHNCQDMPAAALSNSTKVLLKSQYGNPGSGVQVYFGTPKQRGSEFWKMWHESSQQYYYLGCEKCQKHFPLYTPGTNEWEKIWIHGFTVRCTHCGHEQDKKAAAERGKWVATKDPSECKFIGFHINQLYMPDISKENLDNEKPGTHPINTERAYQNEVLGEFFQGEAGIITPDEIREKCGDPERKFCASITEEDSLVFLGIDIGAKNDLAQLVDSAKVYTQGQSYSIAVVLQVTGPNRLSIQFATKFKRNDLASKKGIVDQIMKNYSCNLAVCDIGYAQDFNEILQTEYGPKFLSSQASGKVNGHVKFNEEIFPKIITFERDFWIAELYDQMKKGNIRFPLGDFEKISWAIQQTCSMEIKPSISRSGDVTPHYVKGSGQNDFFMALLNAYIAYKFYITDGFINNNSILLGLNGGRVAKKPPVLAAYLPRMK